MTTELITGHEGAAHVSSADVGQYNAGVIGSGRYVLDTGAQLACEVISANQVSIGTGDAIFDGRHVRVSASENVSIDNGAQGVSRHDIVCFKYEYNAGTDVESVSLAVVKGTAAATATDPEIPSGNILESSNVAYMPLWRIVIEGITVGEPQRLFGDVLTSLYDMTTRTLTADQIPNLPASKITSGTLAVDRIPSMPASKITSGTLAAAQIPNIDAAKITSGTLGADRVPNLPASKITSGTLDAARVPNLDASKITSGILATGRIPNLDASKLASGTLPVARLTNQAWTYIYGSASATSYVRWCKVANIVFVELNVAETGSGKFQRNTNVLLGTIPTGSRPSKEVENTINMGPDSDNDHVAYMWVDTSGRVYVKSPFVTSSYGYGSISYPVI